jgi:translation initiation factor eIF-2B subunit delta
MVASLARQRGLPVIVACESYKFCEKVQLDAIVFNELGSAQELAGSATGYLGAEDKDAAGESLSYHVINVRYDLTPLGNISAIATETGEDYYGSVFMLT